MGLYGAVTQDSAAGVAYPAIGSFPAVSYDNEVVLFYSEIDPDMNAAIAGGTHADLDPLPPALVPGERRALCGRRNGRISMPVPPVDRTLVRFLSAAGKTHVPVLQGLTMTIHAEDGLQYNYQDGATVVAAAPREQYSAMLPPLKTKDAIVTATGGRPLCGLRRQRLHDQPLRSRQLRCR